MKSEELLGDPRKQKKWKVFLKKKLWNRIQIFFDSELPNETRTLLFITFRLLGTQLFHFVAWNVFWINILINKYLNLKNYTKSEQSCQISRVHTKFQSSITPRKKRNSKKSFYFRILRWTSFLMIALAFLYDEYIDRPKLSEQKNPFEYSSFAHKWGRNNKIIKMYWWFE